MKSRLFLVPALILLALNCAYAQSLLKEGMPFLQARKLLLKNGWSPIVAHPKPQIVEVGTQEEILIKKGIREVDACSMDAGALCNLYYDMRKT